MPLEVKRNLRQFPFENKLSKSSQSVTSGIFFFHTSKHVFTLIFFKKKTMYIVQTSHATEILIWEEAVLIVSAPPHDCEKKTSSNLL